MFKKFFVLFFILINTLFNTSCVTKSVSQKGNIFDDDDLTNISIGLTNKENTLKYLGYPLNQSHFNDNIWIYYSYKMKEVLFFKPSIKEQKVLLVEFDNETNLIKDMSLYSVNSDKFEVLKGTSVIDEQKENIIKDILKNIGQISM